MPRIIPFSFLLLAASTLPLAAQSPAEFFAGSGQYGFSGDGGPARDASFRGVSAIRLDRDGNIYIADIANQRIRRVDRKTRIITTFAGSGPTGNDDSGNGRTVFSGDGGPATSAQLNNPNALAFDADGNLFISDSFFRRIRKVSATSGLVSTIAGTGASGTSGNGGPATSAQFNLPQSLAIDSQGNIYVGDAVDSRVRVISRSSGLINSVAGSGQPGFTGDGGPATSARIDSARGMAFDKRGNLYFADGCNHRIRKVDAATGIISTFAGSGVTGCDENGKLDPVSGDGGPATSARIVDPLDIAFDDAGNLYITQYLPSRVRKVDAITGLISTISGIYPGCNYLEGTPMAYSCPQIPFSLAIDSTGSLFLIDGVRQRILHYPNAVARTEATAEVPHLAVGDGWSTTILFTNPATRPARLSASLTRDSGLPFLARTWDLAARGSLGVTFDEAPALVTGRTRLTLQPEGGITAASLGFATIFRNNGREASAAPAVFQPVNSVMIDGRSGYRHGIALANADSFTKSLQYSVRNAAGLEVTSGVLALPAASQRSFTFEDAFPLTDFAGTFTVREPTTPTPSSGTALLAFRFSPSGGFHLIPTLTSGSALAGIPHFAAGDGWTTTLLLANNNSEPATVLVQFTDTNNVTWREEYQTIPARGLFSGRYESSGSLVTGRIRLSLPNRPDLASALNAVATFSNGFSEASTPPISPASAFTLTVDSRNGYRHGIALANATAQNRDIQYIVRDAAGLEVARGTMLLRALAQRSFAFEAEFPSLSAFLGSISFQDTAPPSLTGSFSVLAFRFNPEGDFYSIPAVPAN
ncbi:MAG: hypothetical protein J0H49_27230 [Acidobacteria bacterium]|nr:hypothetical protein [Acidobacteriota bacterium]